LFGITLVPLYDVFGPDILTYCLEHSEITTLFISKENLNNFKKLQGFGNLENLVVLDDFDPSEYE